MCPDEFVTEHLKNYVNYCECVILPDGDVQYATPSHTYKLQLLSGLTLEEVYDQSDKYLKFIDQIPILANPVFWMCEDLNVISCWYETIIVPVKYTPEQVNSVRRLLNSGCLYKDLRCTATIEKSITGLSHDEPVSKFEALAHLREQAERQFLCAVRA